MAEPIKEGENKPSEAPAKVPVEIKSEEKKPDPDAGKEKKDPTAEALENSNKALKSAEAVIVDLKKQIKASEEGGGGDNPELSDKVAKLELEIEELKNGRVPKEEADRAIDALHQVTKTNEELIATLVHRNTTGKGEGTGVNQDIPKTEVPTESFAKTPQEISILERRGIDPKTGKKKLS